MSESIRDKGIESAQTGPVDIQILEDGYSAAISISENTDSFPSSKQIHLAIEKAGIRYGVNDQVLEKLMDEQIQGKPILFARGKPPARGGSTQIIWHENSEGGATSLDITKTLSHWNQELLFMSVEEGQRIVSKLPATEGEAGINVLGVSVTLPSEDIAIPNGEGTALSKDGLTLIASRSGIATWNGKQIVVKDVHHVKGSVDAQTGNLKHDGSVHIEKDVRSGFKVEAIGDIYIGGNVEGADVYSRGGSVVVRNGIIGQGSARILAGRTVMAGFIQDATVGAKLDVEVERYIISSAITAGRQIIAIKNDGIVRGGTLYAEKRIEVRTAGADNRIATELQVGYTEPVNLSRARYLLRSDQRRNRLELAYIQKRAAFLRLLKERMGQLAPDKEEQLAELEKKENILLSQYNEHRDMEADLDKHSKTSEGEKPEAETIRIHDTIYPEVVVAIGDATMEFDRERKNLIIFRAGDRLSFGPLHQTVVKKV